MNWPIKNIGHFDETSPLRFDKAEDSLKVGTFLSHSVELITRCQLKLHRFTVATIKDIEASADVYYIQNSRHTHTRTER